ncbi:MAG: phospholipase D family protein [Spongiibacteraceae bacterium]
MPSLESRESSFALPVSAAENTRLGKAVASRLDEQVENSGIHLLDNPHEAFAARMLLASTADRTLDLQYYIWHGDVSGTLLLNALHQAAMRGVRVRLLLDDNGTAGLDRELAALATHPNIQIRLFNPFTLRKAKWLGYITHFGRANRRMHNKSFTADNRATIIGGRNVGDDYFGATSGVLKQDLDLLAIGPIVQKVSDDFDRYWSSQSAYPVEQIVAAVDSEQATDIIGSGQKFNNDGRGGSYLDAVRNTSFVSELLSGKLPFEWAATKMVSDDPAKGLGKADKDGLLIHRLTPIIGRPQDSLVLVSPYFVPTLAGVEFFADIANQGVTVNILTNAMEATDVLPVHAGYAKHRKALLKAGVKLYELRRTSTDPKPHKSAAGPFGSSSSSLHAKTFAVDGQRIFVGSFNFDPRSMHLNTELGFVVESPVLARAIADEFSNKAALTAYEVKLDAHGKLYWLEQRGASSIRHDTEPGATIGKRIALRILSVLPIDWLL